MKGPNFLKYCIPLLRAMKNLGGSGAASEMIDAVIADMKIPDAEVEQLIPSGQSRVRNQIQWARFYLTKAGLMDSPKSGVWRLTKEGGAAQFDENGIYDLFQRVHQQFGGTRKKTKKVNEVDSASIEEGATPEEAFDRAYEEMRAALALELLAEVRRMDWKDFEDLVVKLLVQMGYGGSSGDVRHAFGKRTNDEGIDGTIKEDKLGLDIIHVQAKKWKEGNTVGRTDLQKFVGALAGQGAKKGVFITASSFTKDARDYSPKNETKIVLIDGEQLVDLMIDYNLGVVLRETYEIKGIDKDFFEKE